MYVLLLLLLYAGLAFADDPIINSGEYFFDTDPGPGNGTAIYFADTAASTTLKLDLSATSVSPGQHVFCMRFRDSHGHWSWVARQIVFVRPSTVGDGQITGADYVFGANTPDYNSVTTTPITISGPSPSIQLAAALGASMQPTGMNRIWLRMQNSSGTWSPPVSQWAYVRPSVVGSAEIVAAEYLFNQNVPDFAIEPAISIPVASSASSLELSAVLDASTQPTGMNRVWLRMQNSQGVWSQPVAQRVFINAGGAASDHHLAGGETYFDSDPGLGNGLALSSDDGLFEELIEDLNNTYGVGSLSQGTHTAYSRVQDSRGVWSVTRHGDFNVTAPEFFEATILNPNGGEGLWVGDTADIQWTTDIPAGTIKLEINRNFPSPNWALLGENLANTGHFPWVVTGPANNVRIRLTTSYFSATDTTDTDFVIRQGQVAVASPNGGEIWRVDEQRLIQWAPEFLGGHVALEFNPDYPNSNWIVIDTVRTQDSSFAWNVPDYPSEHLRLRVTSTLDPVATDISDADFIIPIASITVVTPNGLEQTQIGDTLMVSWTSENLAAATTIHLNRDYPAGDWEQLATGQPSIGTYKWRAGYPPTTVARIRVSAPTVAGVTDESDAEFTLLPAPPELLPGLPSNPFPPDGEINVVRQPLLSWSPATQTDSYDLYFWDADSVRPATPMVLNLTTTSYQIPAPLYYGERYKWQVVAKNYFGRMESPEWDFTIYSLPDLQVASVTVPPTAFSGQTVQISWITTNTGLGSTNAPLWYDRVYLSALPDFVEQATTMYGAYQNPMFLAPSESYSNNATITLPQGIAGPYYIFVKSDREEQLVEASDSNNVGRCAAAMQVTLTPPADLRVSSIGAASIAYSGTQFSVSWTVQNHGTGETNASSWVDYVILSLDTVADYGERVIGAATRSGSLDADSSYTLNAQVDIPNGVWGNYYLLVSTDAQGHVYEYVYEQNNLKHIPIEIILSPTADLVPTSLGCADSGFTGESFDVSWTIENQGLGSTFVNRWGDNLYLSADTVFSFEQDILFGGATHLYSLLPSGSNYSVQGTFTLPNGLPTGEYYLFVYTDTGNEVLEWAADWNNAFRRLQPIHITLSQGPNLVVTNVSVPSQVTGGQSYTLTYTVTNIGPGDIPSNATWTDNIYINSIPTFNRYTWLGQSVNRQGPLASQASYTVSRTISLGAGYPAGPSYNWVETDVHGTINEYGYEDPNHDGASHTVISYPAQDIEASNLVAPASGQSGQNVNVSWTVQNISAYSTVSTFWTDALYLSVDPVLSPATDTRVATVDRTGGLAAGASYARNISVMLPNGLAGEFYWIVKTDSANTVNDSNPVNNAFARATPIEITLTIPPDLITSALAGESQITAGQPLSLLFDVINQGAGAATTPTWYDALYLSTNVTVDPSDVRLTTLTHSGSLSPSSSYAVNGSCDIPTYAGGNYYILAKADNRDDVYEALNEGNNTTPHALFVTVPPPSDLTVSDALFPDTAGVGDVITVSYTLSNSSGNPAVGWMRDGVYFSLDSIWDVNDPLLAYNDHHVNILSGATLVIEKDLNLDRTLALKDVCVQTGSRGLDEGENGSVADEMPGVVPGDYHIIVRTDLRDNIREDDNLNNALLTPGTIHVDLPELTLSVPDTRSFTAGKERFYKVNVGAGLDLRITLISDRADAANEVYVSYGSVPSLSNFEFNGSEPFSSGQQFFVPSTQAGTYYLMVHARTVPTTPENLTLLVEALPFSILSVGPDHVGQGRVTTTITGAGFRDWTQAFIRLADNTLHEAIKVNITNSTRTDITWELASVPLGTYNVILKNSPADSVESINALTIEPAQGLTYEIMDSSPSSFRATGVANLTICIQNITNVDLPYFWATVFTPGWSRVLGVQCDERFLRFQLPLPDMLDQRYLSWSIRKDGDKHNYTYVLARDIAPGEILCMSIVLAGFPSYALPVSISSEAQSEEDFIADMSRKVDNTRERILAGLLEVIPEFELLAQNAEDFQDSLFEDFEDSGVLDTPTPRPAPGPGEEFVDPPSDPQPCDTIPCEISPCDANICPPDPPFIPPGCNRPAELPNTCNPDLCQQREESICEGVRGVVQKGSKAGLAMGAIVGMYCQIGGYWTCRFLHKNIEEICKTIFVSCDPNDIVGPEGYGDERWIGKTELMPYTIHFENDDSLATAHANVVHVTQQLDSDLNPNSFRLGSFGFGNLTFDVPENRAFYSTRLDVRDSLGIYVDVVAGINVQNNEVFWHFESVDPATGQAPNDPFMGFLAINDSTHRGEGFVNYTITPRNTVETGDVIDAEASIVFDVNDPVETPPIFNTIDADAPVSSVSPLPFQPPDVTFDVNFSGADFVPGSGLASYSIYVSEDRGPFNLFAGSLTDTTVSFTGVPGHMYEFFSLATDYAGNLEPMKSVAEATTFLQVAQLDTVQDLTIRAVQSNDSLHATLRWSALPGNLRYYVYTSTITPDWDNGSTWSLIGSTSGSTITDIRAGESSGDTRFYLVLAYVIP